jgi:hypothetical protein
MNKQITAWVMIDPEGRVLVDSRDFKSAEDVWRIVLGWPTLEEVRGAKRAGWKVLRARVTVEPIE